MVCITKVIELGFSWAIRALMPKKLRILTLCHPSGGMDPQRQARAELVAQARLDGLYGQRWKSETVNSVIKRKFGETIRSRIWFLQHREALIKGLVYNIHRLVTLFLFPFYRTLQQSNSDLPTATSFAR